MSNKQRNNNNRGMTLADQLKNAHQPSYGRDRAERTNTPAWRNRVGSVIQDRYLTDVKYFNNLRPCGQWVGDGVDHMNISLKSEVEVACVLDVSFRLPFHHDVFGKLFEISEVWDNLTMYTNGKTHGGDVNLYFFLADALWQRVTQYKTLGQAIAETSLPFDLYRYNETYLPKRNDSISWAWVETVEAVRYALQTNQEYPDFGPVTQGMERDRSNIILNFLEKYIPNRRTTIERMSSKVVNNDGTSASPEVKEESQLQEALVKEMAEQAPRKKQVFGMISGAKATPQVDQLSIPEAPEAEPEVDVSSDPVETAFQEAVTTEHVVQKTEEQLESAWLESIKAKFINNVAEVEYPAGQTPEEYKESLCVSIGDIALMYFESDDPSVRELEENLIAKEESVFRLSFSDQESELVMGAGGIKDERVESISITVLFEPSEGSAPAMCIRTGISTVTV